MSRPIDAPCLRARLARLLADATPVRRRADEIRRLAERIAARTGTSVRRVLARAARDAAARLTAEVER